MLLEHFVKVNGEILGFEQRIDLGLEDTCARYTETFVLIPPLLNPAHTDVSVIDSNFSKTLQGLIIKRR